MHRAVRFPSLVVVVLLLPAALRPAAADDADPSAFLAAARAKHADLGAGGLTSFAARLRLRRSEAESLRNYKDMAGFGYAWKAPDAETFDFEATHTSLQKPLRDALRGLYREITGRLWFDLLGTAKELALAESEGSVLLSGTTEIVGPVRATFSREDLALARVDFPRIRATIDYGYTPTPEGLRVAWREVRAGDAPPVHTTYRTVRAVSGFPLPTVLDLRSEKNVTEYGLEYQLVNDEPALRVDPTADEIQQRVKAFDAAWRSWNDTQRIVEIRALAELPDDRVSTVIAKRGLKHANAIVRGEAAEALGVMGRENAVPGLLSALPKNEKVIDVYLAIIRALGEIGDPRAVDALSRDWWNQKVGEDGVAAARAKISALGRIRHVTAVDALIDTFFMAKQETIARLHADLVLALGKLTGKEFGNNPRQWKDWWKDARAKFQFGTMPQ